MRLDSELTSLAASPNGSNYTVGWDATNDIGVRALSALLHAYASDANGDGAALYHNVTSVPRHQLIHAFMRRANHHLFHYGDLEGSDVPIAQRHQLVVMHPAQVVNVSRAQIRQVQEGRSRGPRGRPACAVLPQRRRGHPHHRSI